MINLENVILQSAVLGRWTARILGSLSVLFFLALVFGEGPPNPFTLTLRENLSFLCMALLFLGLVLAWFREGWGGAITLSAFTALAMIDRSHLHMPALQIPAALGCLHLVCWLRLRDLPARASFPRSIFAAAGVFALLCANEIFGNPPLMTPALRPGTAIAGTWSSDSNDTVVHIGPDGLVTGTVSGRIQYNRSWFGRLMGWRTDYMIRGTSAGRPFMAPVNIHDSEMNGGALRLRRVE